MQEKKPFDLFVGGKSGVFKGVKIEKGECSTENIQNLVSITKDDEITAMSWGDEKEREVLLGCGSKGNRSVKIYDSQNCAFTSSFICDTGTGTINGLSRYNDGIITAVESGEIKLWRYKDNGEVLIEAGGDLTRMRHCNFNRNIIATGGKEHKLKLFDLEKKVKIFEEKNVRHDWLELKVPLWISDIGFLQGSSVIATCSRYGHIRLYDHKAQRRPVVNLEAKDQAWMTLAIAPKEKHIVVGSGKGIMNLIDLRNPGRILNTYKDFVGGITAISCPTNNPYIVSVGLDRHLRVHHLDTKKLLHKTYLTSRLSCIVLRSNANLDMDPPSSGTLRQNILNDENIDKSILVEDEIKAEAEYDEIFEKMPVIGGESKQSNLQKSEDNVSGSVKRSKTSKETRKKNKIK